MTVSRFGIFCAGGMFVLGVNMFAQDLMGMEAFLERARDGWVHMSPLWWVPLIAMAAWVGTRVRQCIKPGEEIILGADGKPYEITPINPEKED